MRIMKLLILACCYLVAGSVHAQGRVRIAAASDLKFALDSIIDAYGSRSSSKIIVTYGSSGKLYEQLTNAAPFDIFFSADIDYPLKLKDQGLAAGTPEVYGIGRLVVWRKKNGVSITSVRDLANQAITKVAIANPRHAPYGKRAEEALKYYGVFDTLSPKLIFGENISQAAQFAYSGAADAGIIALSLAKSPAMREAGEYFMVSQDSHSLLRQGFVVLKSASGNGDVKSFVEFIRSQRSRDIFSYFGFNPASLTAQ
jgi:molybdate transport system substrate-binding protein